MSRRERQRRRRRSRSGRIRRTVLLGAGLFVVAAVVAGLSVVGYVIGIAESAPSITTLQPEDPGAISTVFAADGTRLGFLSADDLRTPTLSRDIPEVVRDATIAIEDKRYYKHKGIDYEGIVRAAVKNLESGKTVEGGSTITMQLVRNLYITKERTYKRKIREAKLAEELENVHGKRWILDKYLNTVPYGTVGGKTAVGIGAAARLFFDKRPEDLTLREAALLVGLPQAPSQYNPFFSAASARARRNEVLKEMADQGMITRAKAKRTARKSLGVKPNTYYTRKRESYFFDYVKQELVREYGLARVNQGGLKIYTTIDLDWQQKARAAIAGRLNQPGDPSSAIVTIDPRNGYIRAMASSSTYQSSRFNLATQGRRQPGSTFKVMVLMAALRRGVDPDSTYYTSKPLNIQDPKYGKIETRTYSNSYSGSMSLVRATLQSDNTVFQQLILDLGPEAVRQTAYDMGVTTKLDAYPAEGLGGLTIGVSPLEMADAYATISSGGYRNKPIAVRKVVFPDGDVDRKLGRPRRKKVFTDGVALEATRILEKNLSSGTGTAAEPQPCPAGGKTGTTNDFKDAWFVGFTPKLATAAWVGYPTAGIPMASVHGISVAGGTFPTQIWGDYMRQISRQGDCGSFESSATEPFVARPFFGKYASTGKAGEKGGDQSGSDTTGGGFDDQTGQGNGRRGGGKYHDPSVYEKPPQDAPKAKKPAKPKAPADGTGGAGR